MDRHEALELLPPLYAVALRLDDTGVPAGTIARAVDIAPEAVPSFLEVARDKLARLLDGGP